MKTGNAPHALHFPIGTSPWSEHAPSLGRHLLICKAAARWPARAGLWAERAHSLVAPRFVTTVFAASLLLAACTAWA